MSHRKLSFFSLLRVVLLISFFSVCAGLLHAEVITTDIICTYPSDSSSCSSSNADVNADAIVDVSADILALLKFSDEYSPMSCSRSGSSYVCDISPNSQASLVMTCSLDNPSNSASCVARDLSSQEAVLLDCSASSSTCTARLESDTLRDLDKNLCELMISSEKYCQLGYCDMPTHVPTDTTGDNASDRVVAIDTLPKNSQEVAKSFFNCDSSDGVLADLCQDSNESDESEIVALIDSLTPKKPDAALDSAVVTFNQSMTAIQNHLYRMRINTPSASTSASSVPLTQYYRAEGQWFSVGNRLAAAAHENYANDAIPAEPVAVQVEQNMSNDGRFGIFVNVAYVDAEENNTELEAASETDMVMLTVGVDYRFTRDTFAGVAVNYADATTKFDLGTAESSRLDGESISLTLYGSMYVGDGFVDASLLYSFNDYDQKRQVSCTVALCGNTIGEINDVYDGEFDGSQYGVSLSGGYDFNFNAFSLTPFTQLTWGRLKADAYTETPKDAANTSGAQLHISDQRRDVSHLNVGAYFRYVLATGHGVFVPNARISYHYNIQENVDDINGYFAVDSSANGFSLQSDEADGAYFVVALGLNMQLKKGHAGFFEVESIEAYDDLRQFRYVAGWRWEI